MELFPQPLYSYSEGIVINIISIAVPYLLKQLPAGYGFPFVLHQQQKDLVFRLAEKDFFLMAKNGGLFHV